MASRSFEERVGQPYQKGSGKTIKGLCGQDNGGILRGLNAAGSGMVDLIGVNSANQRMLGGAYMRPVHKSVTFNLALNASQGTQRFFIAEFPMEIVAISCSYATADGAPNTAVITKEITRQAPGTGAAVMSNTFDLNTTVNTAQWATLASRSNPASWGVGEPTIALNTGEMLSIKVANAATSLAGLIVTVYFTPATDAGPIVYYMNANAGLGTQYIYLANRYVTVTGVKMVWSTPSSGGITIDVTHETGTTASGSGLSILAAAQAATGTANTVVSPALSATASYLALAPGDRLSVKFSATTSLAGVVVVVSIAPTSTVMVAGYSAPQDVTFADFTMNANSSITTQAFFGPADQDYWVQDASMVWGTAGTGDMTISLDANGVAPGGGTSIWTDNTSAGPSVASTANTPVFGIKQVQFQKLLLPAGGLLSIKSASVGALAGFAASVSLVPA